jgi:hypothetical protein
VTRKRQLPVGIDRAIDIGELERGFAHGRFLGHRPILS